MQTAAVVDHIWRLKYRQPGEAALADSLRRVARAIAAGEQEPQHWGNRYSELLLSGRFVPGGRILAGAGTERGLTLFNCFVQGPIPDDLRGICTALTEAALTMQAGGGIGCDFSLLRPQGFPAHSSGNIASGPVSFMQLWNSMCATLLSGAARRGAMMATLRCNHPDIGRFIDAKRQAGALEHFNLSVQVSDAFLQAVDSNSDWPLQFPLHGPVTNKQPAAELWRQLMDASYAYGEPGVLFVDRINARNNLYWREQLSCTNPCGEVPLPAHGACNLGSLVLPAFVRDGFSAKASVDFDALRLAAGLATRFLDSVIDCSCFPLPAQAEQARQTRRIGLGITGLGDALLMLGLHYGTEAARSMAARLMQCICHAAYRSSIELAREKGSFPAFERDPFLAAAFIRELPAGLRDGIARHGLRNSHLLAIAPAGTISLLAGNVSSGMEPVFAWEQLRRVRDADGTLRVLSLVNPAWQQWRDLHPAARTLPDHFVTALELAPREHLLMQAALQPQVDNAISKTINLPADCDRLQFSRIYREAYSLGLKGCTTFRSGCRTQNVLDQLDSCTHCEPA